jgi:hypothetical protein
MLDVLPFEAAAMVLAPAAVRSLRADQPARRGGERGIVRRNTLGSQPFHEVEKPVGHVDAPDAEHGAVGPLGGAEEADAPGERARDRRCRQRRVGGPDLGEGGDARSRALDVRVLGHARAEHFRRIEPLEPRGAAASLVSAEAAVGVLASQDERDRLAVWS